MKQGQLIEQTPAPQQPVVPTVITPGHLIQMALAQGADLDRLERLMALKREYEKDEARKAYYQATAAMRATPVSILKRKHVFYRSKDGGPGADYWHAELSDVCAALDPVLAANGLSYRWDVQQRDKRVFVTCVLRHALGHEEALTMDGPPDESGKKNAIQQIQSTVTYLQRHTLLGITGTSTVGMDNDGRGAPDDGDEPPRGRQQGPTDDAEVSRLVDAGNAEADKGELALSAWWSGLTPQQRAKATPYFGAMKATARNKGA